MKSFRCLLKQRVLFTLLLIKIVFVLNAEECKYPYGYKIDNKEKCVALSNSLGNSKCCYIKNKCYDIDVQPTKTENTANSEDISDIPTTNIPYNDDDCPKDLLVPNNCGLAGIYQPTSEDSCLGISLVQGYCCYTEIVNKNIPDSKPFYSCLRTNKLYKKNDKLPSDQIKNFVTSINQNYEAKSVVCYIPNLKVYWILNVLLLILSLL